MKLAIIGSRTFKDYPLLKKEVDALKDIQLIISGGAKGADKLAEKYTEEHQIELKVFLPEFDKYAAGAYWKRNEQIVGSCDYLIAFWDGKSTGTKYTIDYAKKQGKEVKICLL